MNGTIRFDFSKGEELTLVTVPANVLGFSIALQKFSGDSEIEAWAFDENDDWNCIIGTKDGCR